MDNIYESFIGRRVEIKYTDKSTYAKQGIIGRLGTVKKANQRSLGVLVDGKINKMSAYQVYWFDKDCLKFLNNESEDIIMENYQNVAIVNLLDDYNKKDYGFALYDEDFSTIINTAKEEPHVMVVVNARGKNNRVLGIIKEVVPVESYTGSKPTAEVVGVVYTNNYTAREVERNRQVEIAKKKAIIEAELEREINKRKSVEYYEEMAKKYSDNPKLAELVGELRNLGI